MITSIDTDRIQTIVQFILNVDRLKTINRKVKPIGLDRYENSAEHSWQIALLALSLSKFGGPDIRMDRVIAMLLVHDIGEIEAGDTFFFVEGGWEQRKQEELEAVTRIFSILPSEIADEFLELWREFELAASVEARFANALDRAMPVLLNLENNGQSWRENNVSYERVISRIMPPIKAGFPALWDYLELRLEDARYKGFFGE